jgi:hypothetical protein
MKNQTEYQMLLQDEHLQIINFDNIKKELKQLNDDILEVTAKLNQQSILEMI